NLPSRDFDVTEAFYAKLGFATSWKDRGWMILQRGGLQLEFFPGYRKYKPPFCSSSEVSYLKFPHSFTAQAPILTAGPA
ncbi:hypothetical protein ACO0TA_31065, partial [Klebsiella pneumoniae]